MSILNIVMGTAGADNIVPRVCYIDTNNTIAEVTATGFLNQAVQQGYAFQDSDMCLVTTKTSPSATPVQVGWFEITKSGANTSLTSTGSPGSVALPTVANQIAYATDAVGSMAAAGLTTALFNAGRISAGLSGTAGSLRSYSSTAARGYFEVSATANTGDTAFVLTNAAQAAARTITIPDGGQTASSVLLTNSAGTQTIATGSLALTLGNITAAAGNIAATLGSVSAGTTVTAGTNVVAGNTASAGTVTSFAGTGSAEFLRLAAIDNAGGNFSTTISNAASVGQSQTISIPDAGAATANFLLDTGAANLLAQQQFVGLSNVLQYGTGTWTVTRVAQGNYAAVHTPGDETSIIAVDITPIIRATASKGFRLDSFDVIYSIGTLAMDAHTLTLDRIAYANNVAVSVTSVPLTGTLSTATNANPYVTNIAVTTPAFDTTADSKYVVEITANNAATTDYSFYGIMLRFSQTIG